VEILKPHYTEIWHVENITLPQPAKDSAIWDFAKANNAIIVTNDNDFYKLSILKGFPPKVIILRTGNQSNKYITEILIKHVSDIKNLSESNEYGLLEIV
jgi:predicted nuclease of predicted toxin-antitoxin system